MYDRKKCHCLPEVDWKCRACKKVKRHLVDLQLRILNTLEAHLTWVARANEMGNPGAPHRWITGKEIKAGQNRDWLPPASLTDTPFEIIKTYDLHQFYVENKPVVESIESDKRDHLDIMNNLHKRSFLARRLETSIRTWLKRLYESDKRCQYVFPRPQKEECEKGGMKKYHLGEHVWICRATKCVEILGLYRFLEHPQLHGSEARDPGPNQREKGEESPSEVSEKQDQSDCSEREGGPNNTDQPQRQQPAEHILRYQTEELRRTVLKRFTTRNPETQRRMLATCRTPSESRFLFHAKDTALFYAMDDGFFDREVKKSNKRSNWANKVAVWRETVEVQADHEETQTLDWEKPLYYALALIISSLRKRINRTSPDEMLHASADILFALSSFSGLFPGRLNEKRQPVAFEDEVERDKYWHATFEIPYILWMYGKAQFETSPELEKADTFGTLLQGKPRGKDSSQLRQPMSKRMEFAAFDSLIDKSRLVEVSDDWLREPPSFLMFDSPVDVSVPDRDFGRVINDALKGWSVAMGSPHLTGTVFDVPRRGTNPEPCQSTIDLRGSLLSNAGMLRKLYPTRTVQRAKKRLIWLPNVDKHTALTCYLASPDMEQDNLSAFFDRHASYEKHFSDGTSAALNEWSTELHLSYFRIANEEKTAKIRQNRPNMIPDLSFILMGEKSTETSIVRSAMSFRFVGDFFDRYWTCHFMESSPTENVSALQSRLSDLGFVGVKDTKVPERTKQPWQQRKVLELLFFEYLLKKIYSKAKKVFDWARDEIFKESISTLKKIEMASVLEKPFAVRATWPLNPLAESLQAGAPSLLGNGSAGYFAMAERWRFFDTVLQAMEEDLTGNLETISLWNCREKDRGPERPRWTRDDEMTYRQVINKLQVMNQKRTRDLDDLTRDIRIFRDSFNVKLDTMRSDLEYQGSANTNIFTYVTVVFLPLGFATGIFSMSGAPDSLTLVNMIELSLITMALTLFALSSAKTSGKKIVRPVIAVFNFISIHLLDPLLDLLLRPFRVLEAFLSFLGNICLLLRNLFLFVAVLAKTSAVYCFYLFIALPFLFRFTQWLKKAYQSITKTSENLEEEIKERNDLDILKAANERFKEREKDKKAKRKAKLKSQLDQLDLESGGLDSASSKSKAMGA